MDMTSRVGAGFLCAASLLISGGNAGAYAGPPKEWYGGGQGYELLRDDTIKHGGKASGSVKAGADANGFGTLTQGFQAEKYRGKRLRMSGFVKTDNVENAAGLWMRVDSKEKGGIAFDNMMTRKIEGTTDWQKYEVVLDIADDAEQIFFGFLVSGKGQGWVDDITFEVVGKDVATTGLESQASDRQGDLPEGLPKEPQNIDFEK